MATTTTVANVSASGVETTGRKLDVIGSRRVAWMRVSNTGTYATGGIDFDPRTFGFDYPVAAVFLSVRSVAATPTRRFEYDYVNKKIIGFVTSTGAEVAAGQDVSTIVFDALVVAE